MRIGHWPIRLRALHRRNLAPENLRFAPLFSFCWPVCTEFYFADVGMVNLLAKRGQLDPGSELFGRAFENWVFHELSAHAAYSEQYYELSYWRLASGIEVDFILDDMAVAIEVKGSAKIAAHHLQGLRELKKNILRVKRRIVVSLEPRARRTEDNINILPAAQFAEQLWSKNIR